MLPTDCIAAATSMDSTRFTPEYLKSSNSLIFEAISKTANVHGLRLRLSELAHRFETEAAQDTSKRDAGHMARIRDCSQILRNILKCRSDELADFSVAQAFYDICNDISRPDLTPAFYADIHHILTGLQGKGPRKAFDAVHLFPVDIKGRPAAIERSRQLDSLYAEVDNWIAKYTCGLEPGIITMREERREQILSVLNGTLDDWYDWRWQIKNIVRDTGMLEKLVNLDENQLEAVRKARQYGLPFGVTPYYLSLMDNEEGYRDAAIRAQVLPPMEYVNQVATLQDISCMDFMGEEDTSPSDLITRRYPAICILKPFNTCPQICVYCQRNWEIDDAMASGAFAGLDSINEAIQWIADHPSIHEVLVTGGDPLAMGDNALITILKKLADIPSIERIRIGTRTIVTMPMRIHADFADYLSTLIEPGRREVAIVTHVQHPYEITPDMVKAVSHFRKRGISVYNQFVYTFYSSKRFEACALRRKLRLIGIDPYYTFNTKGKEETLSYRAPIARLVQEQQEEARLLPGLERTDEAVFNVPRQGKNYLKAREYRSLLSILPDGSRVYEFYPWEKQISQTMQTYISEDVPILDYLERLEKAGENPSDYDTIWFYY